MKVKESVSDVKDECLILGKEFFILRRKIYIFDALKI